MVTFYQAPEVEMKPVITKSVTSATKEKNGRIVAMTMSRGDRRSYKTCRELLHGKWHSI